MNQTSQLLKYNPSGQDICFEVSEQVFNQAVVKTIIHKPEKEALARSATISLRRK